MGMKQLAFDMTSTTSPGTDSEMRLIMQLAVAGN